jgi:hypothetical protein
MGAEELTVRRIGRIKFDAARTKAPHGGLALLE